MRVTVLGAGYMGSAITFPLSENDNDVNLWGTWLDDEIIDFCREGKHPKLQKELNPKVNLYFSKDLEEALDGAEVIFMAVSSEGFIPVYNKIQEYLKDNVPIFSLTKGLVEQQDKVFSISRIAEKIYEENVGTNFKWVSIGGPVKAVELAYYVPTFSIYASKEKNIKNVINKFATGYYNIKYTGDVIGVELCSAFKNVYSVSLGICDGLYMNYRESQYHNFSSVLFNQGAAEIAEIVKSSRGEASTSFGLAGIGDLYVTSQSGRNRRFGELIGRGVKADEAYHGMLLEGDVAEGYRTLKLGFKYLKQQSLLDKTPLLNSLYNIIYKFYDPEKELLNFLKKIG